MGSTGKTRPLPFDDDSEVSNKAPYRPGPFVLTSNWSIGPLLARGCLLPPSAGELTEVPYFDDQYPNCLVVSKGPIPLAWCDALRGSRRNAFPIALSVVGPLTKVFEKKTEPRLKSIALSDIESLLFFSDKERKQFLSMTFADFDIAKLGLTVDVDPDAFESERDTAAMKEHSPPQRKKKTRGKQSSQEDGNGARPTVGEPIRDFESARQLLRQLDSDAALRTTLVSHGLGQGSWIETLTCFEDDGSESTSEEVSWVSAIRRGIWSNDEGRETSLERAVLAATACVTSSEFRLDAGWPATEVLDRIEQETKRRCSTDTLERDGSLLEKWAKRTRAVLAAQVEPPDLLDEKSVGLRAVLLLLLRGELEPILSTTTTGAEQTVVKIGPIVRLLALCLASVRTGLRSLPVDLKVFSEGDKPWNWLSSMGNLITGRLGLSSDTKSNSSIEFRVDYRAMGVLRGEWVFSLGSDELVRRSRDADPGLVRIDAMGRELGYVFEEKTENCLRTDISTPDGVSRPVYVALHRAVSRSTAFLRFWSPAMDVSTKSKKAQSKWPTPLLNKRPKQFFVDLLERNSKTDLNCRFALSREEQAVIVLVDQLLATLDEEEFRQHVEHVAKVADAYERETST